MKGEPADPLRRADPVHVPSPSRPDGGERARPAAHPVNASRKKTSERANPLPLPFSPRWSTRPRSALAVVVFPEPCSPPSARTGRGPRDRTAAISQATCKANEFFDRRDRALLLFLLDSGVRASELCHLDLGDVDFATGAVTVRQGKGSKDRIVYLGPTALRALQRYLRTRSDASSSALFVSKTGGRLTYDGILELIHRRCARAGLAKRYSPHDFRRAYAVNMLRAGVDLYSLARLMGHADIQVLRRYLKLTAQDIEAAHRKGSPVESYRWT